MRGSMVRRHISIVRRTLRTRSIGALRAWLSARAKIISWRTISAARWAAYSISESCSVVCSSAPSRQRAALWMMTLSALLKLWAIPAVSCPTASIFCA